MVRAGHNRQIPLDRQKARLQLQLPEELSHRGSRLDLAQFFVNDNLQWDQFQNGRIGKTFTLPEVYVPSSKTVKHRETPPASIPHSALPFDAIRLSVRPAE